MNGALLESRTAVYSIVRFDQSIFLYEVKRFIGDNIKTIAGNGFLAYTSSKGLPQTSETSPANDIVLHVLSSLGLDTREYRINESVLLFRARPSGNVASLRDEDYEALRDAYCTY